MCIIAGYFISGSCAIHNSDTDVYHQLCAKDTYIQVETSHIYGPGSARTYPHQLAPTRPNLTLARAGCTPLVLFSGPVENDAK